VYHDLRFNILKSRAQQSGVPENSTPQQISQIDQGAVAIAYTLFMLNAAHAEQTSLLYRAMRQIDIVQGVDPVQWDPEFASEPAPPIHTRVPY